MYFSNKLIEELVLELAGEEEISPDTVHNFVYHLKLPGPEIPSFVARVIAERPSIGKARTPFPPRLAYGILEDGWSCFDENERKRDHVRLCRQVARIALGLQKLDHPLEVIKVFEGLFTIMIFASNALHDLGVRETEVTKAELTALVERVLEAIMVQDEETCMLLNAVVRRLRRVEKLRMKDRVRHTIDEGLDNDPWDDTAALTPIFDLNGPVRFRRSLVENKRFADAAQATCDYVLSV